LLYSTIISVYAHHGIDKQILSGTDHTFRNGYSIVDIYAADFYFYWLNRDYPSGRCVFGAKPIDRLGRTYNFHLLGLKCLGI